MEQVSYRERWRTGILTHSQLVDPMVLLKALKSFHLAANIRQGISEVGFPNPFLCIRVEELVWNVLVPSIGLPRIRLAIEQVLDLNRRTIIDDC